MNTRSLGFVAVLTLLAPWVRADDIPAVAPPPSGDVQREVLRGFNYHLPVPARIAVPVLTAEPAAAAADDDGMVVQLAAVQVNGKQDQTYRDLNAAIADEQLSVPCDLFVRNSAKFQFRALGPPLFPSPMDRETPSEQLPALFPLVTLAW